MKLDDAVRQYLLEKDKIDVLDAAQLFGCFSLPQVISRLRAKGMRIKNTQNSRLVSLKGKSLRMLFTAYEVKPEVCLSSVYFRPPTRPGGFSMLGFTVEGGPAFQLNLNVGQSTEELADQLRKLADKLEE